MDLDLEDRIVEVAPPNTLICFLCKRVITFVNGEIDKFVKHMKNIHNAYFNINVVLAVNFLDQDSLKEIVFQFQENLQMIKAASEHLTPENDGEQPTIEDDSEQPTTEDDSREMLNDTETEELVNNEVEIEKDPLTLSNKKVNKSNATMYEERLLQILNENNTEVIFKNAKEPKKIKSCQNYIMNDDNTEVIFKNVKESKTSKNDEDGCQNYIMDDGNTEVIFKNVKEPKTSKNYEDCHQNVVKRHMPVPDSRKKMARPASKARDTEISTKINQIKNQIKNYENYETRKSPDAKETANIANKSCGVWGWGKTTTDPNAEYSNDTRDVCKTVCKICQKNMAVERMRSHTKEKHNMRITEYKEQYGQSFELVREVFHKCGICGVAVLFDSDNISHHLKKKGHNITHKNYNEQYMLTRNTNRRLNHTV